MTNKLHICIDCGGSKTAAVISTYQNGPVMLSRYSHKLDILCLIDPIEVMAAHQIIKIMDSEYFYPLFEPRHTMLWSMPSVLRWSCQPSKAY